jgi:polyhydroxybutyrate depolymerase
LDSAVGRDAPSSPACSGPVAAGDQTISLTVDGGSRDYILHVPAGYSGASAVPLVVNFHGYLNDASDEITFTGMNTKADSAGFIVAYPDGIDESWNAGVCCGEAESENIDDVAFARAVVADIETRVCVDPKRVYATGMSNGGFLSHRLGCEAADLFAAIAPVAGVLGIPPASCNPSRPMPIIEFHGTADVVVPYDGSSIFDYPSVPSTFQGWATRDGCTDASPTQTFQNGGATCQTYEACSAGAKVTLCTVTGEGHCWPGQSVCPYGASSTDISANDAMWTFFGGFALP